MLQLCQVRLTPRQRWCWLQCLHKERLGLSATLFPAVKHLSPRSCSIVHFDLKPDNLLLDYTADGLTVKVIWPCAIAMEVQAVCFSRAHFGTMVPT